MYSQSMFCAKMIKVSIFPIKFSIFASGKKSVYIAWASFGDVIIIT